MEWKKPYIREPTVPHLEDELGKGGDSVLDGWGLGYDLHGAKLQGAVFFVDTVLSGRSPRRFPPSLMMPLSRLCSFILTAHPHCESRVKDRFTRARPIGGQPCLSAMGRSGVSFPAGLSQQAPRVLLRLRQVRGAGEHPGDLVHALLALDGPYQGLAALAMIEIGRASCRERV